MQFFRFFAKIVIFATAATIPARAMAQDDEVPPRLPAADFAKLPQFQNLTLSPDGKYLAFIMPIRGRNNVVIQPANKKNGEPHLFPPIKTFDIDWILWANAERLLIAYSSIAGGEGGIRGETRLLAVNTVMSEAISVVKAKRSGLSGMTYRGQIQTKIIDILPSDPDHILMALDPMRDGVFEVAKVNIYTRQQSIVQKRKRGIQSWMTDHEGIPRLGYGYRNRSSNFRVHYRNPETNKWTEVQKTDWYEADFSPSALMEDPQYAYAFGPINGRNALVRLNIAEGKIEKTLFAHEKLDVHGLKFDSTRRKVIGVVYGEHFVEAHYFDPKYRKIQNMIDTLLPDTANYISQALPGGKVFIIMARNGRTPTQYHVLNLEEKKLYFLLSTRPNIEPEQMAAIEPVTYAARDELEIPAYLTYPKGRTRENLPTIILPHGGPHSRDTMDFDYLAQFLANRGYLVFQPNFRGSSGYGKAFLEAGRRQWGGLMQDDLTDGTKWLIEQGLADPERICIVGWSYGGYAALMAAVKTPDLFKCAASINGVANLPGLVAHDRRFIGGSAWTKSITLDEEGRKAASPHHRAEAIKIPVFLAAAKDDIRVPYKQSKSFYNKIRKEVPATYIQIKTGGHGLDHEDGRQKMLEGLNAFLAEHLPTTR